MDKPNEPSNIAELINFYISKGVPSSKIMEARDDYFKEQKDKYKGTRPLATFAEIQQYFKRRFG